jgi:hypothetical protein
MTNKTRNVLGGIWLAGVALVALIMLYGVARYPYAPIRSRDGGYFDKAGKEYSESDYHRFTFWERSLFFSAGGLFVISVPLLITERRKRIRK